MRFFDISLSLFVFYFFTWVATQMSNFLIHIIFSYGFGFEWCETTFRKHRHSDLDVFTASSRVVQDVGWLQLHTHSFRPEAVSLVVFLLLLLKLGLFTFKVY